MPKLNKALSEMTRESHAAHVLDQLAATYRKLTRIAPPILVREIDALESEGEQKTVRVDVVETELLEIEKEVRDNKRSFFVVHSLQVDAGTHDANYRGSSGNHQGRIACRRRRFCWAECTAICNVMNEGVAHVDVATGATAPRPRGCLLDLNAADQQLTALETFMVDKLQTALGRAPGELPTSGINASASLSHALPFGALRRTMRSTSVIPGGSDGGAAHAAPTSASPNWTG